MPTSESESSSAEAGRVSSRLRLYLMKHKEMAAHLRSGCFAVEGTLKGWDQLLNLVLDDIEELLVGKSGPKQA